MEMTLTKTEFFFQSASRGHTIRAVEWRPAGEIRAVVQLAHGVAEYIDRYDAFAAFLCENGFAVFGNDHLGHGKSVSDEAELGWFGENDGWNLVIDDMKRLYDIIRGKHPGKPVFLFGHSMGSFLSRSYLCLHPEDYDGVILSGTGQQSALICRAGALVAGQEIRRHGSQYRSPLLHNMAFGSYLKKIENPATANDWLSRDAALVARYTEDPLCGFVATAGLMRDMMQGLLFMQKKENLAKMRKLLPVLFLSGAEDPVGGWTKGVEQSAAAFKKAGMRDLKVKLYPGGRHEMLNEINKEEVFADILAWLNEKL